MSDNYEYLNSIDDINSDNIFSEITFRNVPIPKPSDFIIRNNISKSTPFDYIVIYKYLYDDNNFPYKT